MAQKNRLKYIILGLLNTNDQTGYDLTKSFSSDIGEFWDAKHSQIYPLLKKMEIDNLIIHKDIKVGQKLFKKQYSITKDGYNDFLNWLKEPSELTSNHDEFLLKLYFIRDKHSKIINTMINDQLFLHQKKLESLNLQLSQKFPNKKTANAQYGHFAVLKHAISREKDYINWLNLIIEDHLL